jgi:dihydrolipoamide dehydrogenase
MAEKSAEVVVVGAGPGGYVAAIRAAQLGKKVLVVERDQIGGICLNVGCIPSKALIAAGSLKEKIEHAGKLGLKVAGPVDVDVATLVGWKASIVKQLTGGVSSLFKRHGIETIAGDAKLAGPGRLEVKGKDGTTVVTYGDAILATGSRPIEIPGFKFDEKDVWSSTGALAPTRIPKRLLVIGGGYIGLELGIFYSKVGSAVTVVEMLPAILPGTEADCALVVGKSLAKRGISISSRRVPVTSESSEEPSSRLACEKKCDRRVFSSATWRAASAVASATRSSARRRRRRCVRCRSTKTFTLERSTSGLTGERM